MGKNVGTPPGFSRWYFNFIATPLEHLSVAQKLKYHRLKPGGVPTFFPIFVVVKFKYHRLKARWCEARQDGRILDTIALQLERTPRCVGQRIQHEVGSTCCRHTARGCVQSNL
jgi:hypothetical protein